MLTSGRSSVSAGVSGSLPASSRCMSGWCISSAMISSHGTGSSPRSSGSTVVTSDGSGSRSSSSTAGSVSNWRAGSACSSASGSFPTKRPLRRKTYRWSYGWGHTSSCENQSSGTCRNSSTGFPSGEAQFSTRGIMKARVRVASLMSINCCEVRREQAFAAGFSRPVRTTMSGCILRELGPSCLSWCQRSRTCLDISKTFVVSVHVHLLWSSN